MQTDAFLEQLNSEFLALLQKYENYFWQSYMGDHNIDTKMNQAEIDLNNFKSNTEYFQKIKNLTISEKDTKLQQRLKHRHHFFNINQTPEHAKPLKDETIKLETQVQKKMAEQKQGYTDPYTNEFVKASNSQMSLKMTTEKDEKIRKACFDGKERTATEFAEDLVNLVKMRNEFAQMIGYKNFYEYKANIEEQMTSDEIFNIFDILKTQLEPLKQKIKKLEEKEPNILKPRNFGYMMAGNFINEEDQYFPIEKMIQKWGVSFSALNIDYQGAELQLDLLEREGKYNNGFCHQPTPTYYQNGQKNKGQTNFTCNAIPGQVGSGNRTGETLFHEGGHAAHFSNMEQKDTILNTEYPPASTTRAEIQSMFLDTLYSSIERKSRYAENLKGEKYPFELFEKKVKKLHKIASSGILSIASVVKFEEILYNTEPSKLNKEFVIETAKKVSLDYFNYSEPTLRILTVPHIYSRNSSAYYHGYGMAILGLEQRRDYFYKKYGYIVDNPEIGKEMTKVRKLGSSKTMQKLVQTATGYKLGTQAYLDKILKTESEIIEEAKQKLEKMKEIPKYTKEINLNAKIAIVDGKNTISTNIESFEKLCQGFENFIQNKKSK